jgi:integrase
VPKRLIISYLRINTDSDNRSERRFRATGITAYLRNGGRLEVAQQIAAHESSRTTGLYDRRGDDVSLDEVELKDLTGPIA